MKKLFKTVSVVLMVLVLVGCAKQNIHMDITNSEVTISVTDAMNSSLRTEEEVASMMAEYKAKGYDVKEYNGEEDGMIGVVYSRTYKLSEVSGEQPVVYHLEEGMKNNFTNPRIFQVKEGILGNEYTAHLVLDTSVFLDLDEGETAEEYESEIDEYASYVDLTYTVTLPSKAKSHNADSVDGKTYTWNVEYGEKVEINYVFKTTSPIVYAVIVLVAVVVIVAVAYVIIKKVKGNKNNQMPVDANGMPVPETPVVDNTPVVPVEPVEQPIDTNQNVQ